MSATNAGAMSEGPGSRDQAQELAQALVKVQVEETCDPGTETSELAPSQRL